MKNKFVRGAPASLKSSVIALQCRPDFTVGTVVTEFSNLNVVGVTRFQGGRGQVAALTAKGKAGVVIVMDNRVKAAIRIV